MKIYPDYETMAGYAKEFKSVPVMTEMMADLITPVSVFLSVRQKNKYCFLLESAENENQFGRYSFIGCETKRVVSYKNGILSVTEDGETTEKELSEPFTYINELIKNGSGPVMPGMPKFTGGLVGYFGYDTVRYVETTVKDCPDDDLNAPEVQLMDCGMIIVFDHLRHKVLLITHVPSDGNIRENYDDAAKRLEETRDFLGAMSAAPKSEAAGNFTADTVISRNDFINIVNKAKEYIYNGDIFQVVLSQRFDISNPPDPFNVYRALRVDEPSPYMYYFNFNTCRIAGSSPEKLVSVENGLVTTNPIAGTIRRGKTEAEDKELEKQLSGNEKERAEHIMLVDLSRNDLGRICEFSTVNVDKLMEIGRFSKLMHIISQVTGTLKDNLNLTDVLRACLPAGTLSGAPKVRAMQIIDELETKKRGLYGGAIGYLGYNGVMDTCIAIRTAFFINEKAYLQAGAGIVADSVPEAEYEEARTKAAAMLQAFEKAGEII